MKLFVNCLIIFVLSLPAHAFEPRKHADFSREAAAIYQVCTGRELPGNVIDAFVKGSVREDDPTLERALNWHFYNRDGKIGTYRKFFLTCEGSNGRIFQKRLDTLDYLIDAKRPLDEIYAVAGRAVHHIQDMSSPPHAMPIYHTIFDKFDKYEFTPTSVDVSGICADAGTKKYVPLELLENAARNTLEAVERPVVFDDGKTVSGETWLKFWGGPEDQCYAGFSTYGAYGNSFGKSKPRGDSACALYNENVYNRFFTDCYIRAITDTIRFLIYLDERISQ